jgi:hypothetical protein
MNWNDIQLFRRVEDRLKILGYQMMPSKYGIGEIGVQPLDDKNPIYSRDAEVYCGSIEQIACWIRGIEHQDGYLKMLKATSDAKIKSLEEKYIKKLENQAMLDQIRDPDKKINKHAHDLIKARNK